MRRAPTAGPARLAREPTESLPAAREPAEARSGTRQRAEPADRAVSVAHTALAGHSGSVAHTGHQADRKPPAGTARTGSAEQADHNDPAGHPARTGYSANNYSG